MENGLALDPRAISSEAILALRAIDDGGRKDRKLLYVESDVLDRNRGRRSVSVEGTVTVAEITRLSHFSFQIGSGIPPCIASRIAGMPHSRSAHARNDRSATSTSPWTFWNQNSDIVITGSENGARERCNAAGASAFLLKPITKAALFDAIDAARRGHEI